MIGVPEFVPIGSLNPYPCLAVHDRVFVDVQVMLKGVPRVVSSERRSSLLLIFKSTVGVGIFTITVADTDGP